MQPLEMINIFTRTGKQLICDSINLFLGLQSSARLNMQLVLPSQENHVSISWQSPNQTVEKPQLSLIRDPTAGLSDKLCQASIAGTGRQ